MTSVGISWGHDVTDNGPRYRVVPLENFLVRLQQHRHGTKDGSYFIPARFRNGSRLQDDVEALSGFVIDLDRGCWSRGDIEESMPDVCYVVYSTHSATPKLKKWRILVPYVEPIEPAQHAGVYRHFREIFGDDMDERSATLNQLWYLPRVPEGATYREAFQHNGDLFRWDAEPEPDEAPEPPPRDHGERPGKGNRNNGLIAYAGRLVHLRLNDQQIEDLIRAENGRLAPPLSERELEATVLKSVRRYAEKARTAGAEQGRLSESVCVTRVRDIEERPIDWLWQGYVARGKGTLFAGDPGLGKSLVSTTSAAIVSTGGQWPDGTPCPAGDALILSAEDDAADTIKPRLIAAGADVDRVHIIDPIVTSVSHETGEKRTRLLSLKDDAGLLAERLVEHPQAALLIIDPVSAFLGGVDSHKNADVRAAMVPIDQVARTHGVAVVGITHLNKGAGGNALYRMTGSLAFVAAARAAFFVTRDPDDRDRRLMLPGKNNLGGDTVGFAFRIIPPADPATQRITIEWEAEPVTISADEALTAPSDDHRCAVDEASDFLREELKNGPRPQKELQSEACGAGLSWSSVRRAKDALGIVSAKAQFGGGWRWCWPWQLDPEHKRFQAKNATDTEDRRT